MSSSKGISQARIDHEVPLAMTQWRITAAIRCLSSPAMRPMAAMASSLAAMLDSTRRSHSAKRAVASAGCSEIIFRMSAMERHYLATLNLAISQRELDQAASDQQTAKAICGRRCQQEAPTPATFVG